MGIFTRDEAQLLNYDAVAFFYFAGTMLTVTVLPWTWALVRHLCWPRPSAEEDFDGRGPVCPKDAVVKKCPSAVMEAKRRRAIEMAYSWKQRLRGYVWLQLFVVAVLWLLLGAVILRVLELPGEMRSFDPYDILGLGPGAELPQIKKAYRTKSLAHHPDKDRDNPLATVQFDRVVKAYAVLTDDRARRNYEKFGNPDGPGERKVSIALHPIFLASKENQLMTLCSFFAILFFFPTVVLCFCLRGPPKSPAGIATETLRMLDACIDVEVGPQDGPGLLAATQEAWRLGYLDLRQVARAMLMHLPQPLEPSSIVEVRGPSKPGEAPKVVGRGVVRRVRPDGRTCDVEVCPLEPNEQVPGGEPARSEMKEFPVSSLSPFEPRAPCPFSDAQVRRGTALVWAHLWRMHKHMTPRIRAEIDHVLRRSVPIGRAMISAAMQTGGGRSGSMDAVRGMIIFRRCLIQALAEDSSPLLQIPHVTAEAIEKHLGDDAPSLREVAADERARAQLIKRLNFDARQSLDVDAFCRHMPRVELSGTVEVLDEDGVAEDDLATLTVKLVRTNLAEGEAIGPVHAPFFPVPKFEEWWLLLYDDRARRLVTGEVMLGTGRSETAEIRFLVPRKGPFNWTVHAMCDSYAGFDAQCSVSFTALKQSQVAREVFVHPDDVNIRSFFDELMAGLQPEEDSEESEDELPSRAAPKAVAAAPAPTAGGTPQGETASAEEGSNGQVQRPTNGTRKPPADSSDSEIEDESAAPETHGLFFKAVDPNGCYIYRQPQEAQEMRLGMLPPGGCVRAFLPDAAPEGWAELPVLRPGQPSQWILLKSGGKVSWKSLGNLYEQPLHTALQTNLSLRHLQLWVKKSKQSIGVEDVQQFAEIDNPRVRMALEEMIRRRIGDARYEALIDEAAEKTKQLQQRIAKARGIFISQNGILWHVGPSGQVRGLHPDGQRLGDRVSVSADNKVVFGPFRLDETRHCSCIHWIHRDDPEKQWVWSRDKTLNTRLRLGRASW